jgi:hypothetical protein
MTYTAKVAQAEITNYSADGLDAIGTIEVFHVTEAQEARTIRHLRRALKAEGIWTQTTSEPYGLRTPATAKAQRIILDHTYEGGFEAWMTPPED